jgi:acetamidase/formamidase
VYLPVHVDGAKFSVGDLHFSQGDGEISFCGAIEMAGVITINFSIIKKGMANLGLKSPIYIPGPVEPQFGPGRYIYFEGFSVDERGKQRMSFPPFLSPPHNHLYHDHSTPLLSPPPHQTKKPNTKTNTPQTTWT